MKASHSRARARTQKPLADKKAVVCVERNGSWIRVDDVDAKQAGIVMADLLETMRALTKRYPELIVELEPVGGGVPIDASADDYEQGRRVGFKPKS